MKNKKIIKNTDARKRRNNENFKTELSVCSAVICSTLAGDIVQFSGERWKQVRKREILKLKECVRMEEYEGGGELNYLLVILIKV